MTEEKDFEPKSHLTRHLTGDSYQLLRERTRIMSWAEKDYLNWNEFLAETLDTEKVSPFALYLFCENMKYKKAFGSYKIGLVKKLSGKWLFIVVGALVGVMLLLYFTGNLPT